jgi:hypothetical protein
MTDGGDADRLPSIGHLIEDAKGADPQRVEAGEPSAERLARVGLALEQAEGVLDRVDQRPIQLKQIEPRPPGEDEPWQAQSAVGRAAASSSRSSAKVIVSPRSISIRPS